MSTRTSWRAAETAASPPVPPTWVGPLFGAFGLALVPWTAWLALSLPRRHTDPHYVLTWVGFDVGLMLALAAVATLAFRRSAYLDIVASAAGTMLLTDAWFDVTSAGPGLMRWEAVGAAVLLEVPIAVLCWWIARHAEAIRNRT